MIKNILGQECFSGFCFPTPDVEKLKTGKASSTLQYQGGIAKNRAEEERDDANARAHSKEQQLRALKAEWTVLSNHDAKIQEELVEKRVMVNALQKEPWLLFASSIMQSVSVEHRYLQCKGVCVCVSVFRTVYRFHGQLRCTLQTTWQYIAFQYSTPSNTSPIKGCISFPKI